MSVTLQIPAKFWDDHHIGRGCSETAIVIKENKQLVTVELDDEAWGDLYSDASYYAEQDGSVWASDFRGLISSAKATLRRMNAVAR